ncbi:MAG: FAD-binding protein [Bdellovibrionales bacterium]|nr:FAD-binding protein [Bdellovibrionales bacterium]
MKNWAGNLEFHPKSILTPTSTESAQALVKAHLSANKNIRMRGSAHSWTGLIATKESFLHLDEMQGLMEVDASTQLIKAKAGTKLSLFGEEAFKHNLALPNQGDINHQSLAGAMSTGTHGTGVTLQSMSNQIKNLTLIAGTGEILNIDGNKNPELLNAVGVSFGSVGLMTEATLKMIPAYKLKVETFAEDMKTSLEKFKSRLKDNRHLEMFYFPVGDWSIVKMMNVTEEKESPQSKFQKVSELVLENWLYEGLNILAHKTNSYRGPDKFMRKFVDHKVFVNWSHRAFPSARTVRFMEMEFNLPIEKFEEVFEELKASIKKNNFQTLFPIEIRFVKGDELWLSPAYKRDSVYFAIHTYIQQDFRPYFEEMQNIFKRHGGRPHWGKWHSLKHDDLAAVYPKWQEFKQVRSELDPKGLWLNEHLRSLFDKPEA